MIRHTKEYLLQWIAKQEAYSGAYYTANELRSKKGCNIQLWLLFQENEDQEMFFGPNNSQAV